MTGAAAPADALAARLAAALRVARFARLGVAVSGGGDSMALLHLLAGITAASGTALAVVTVDHGLRDAAADEARFVARAAAALRLQHETLVWRGWDGRGNLMQAARRARYGLIAGWARAEGIGAVALGHTADDQAETFLMRLARGAGLDGLSCMAPERSAEGMLWLRPLLGTTRMELRDWLRARAIGWVEDPSNADTGYERVKARAALPVLDGLGIGVPGIAAVTAHLREVRAALDAQTHAAAVALARVQLGDLVLDRAGLAALPAEIRRRLLAHCLRWIAQSRHPPRGPALAAFAEAIATGAASATLHGCLALPEGTALRICREAAAVGGPVPQGALWDGRWRITGPQRDGAELRALGDAGLRLCLNWRQSARPRVALLADPALWLGQELLAAPTAGEGHGWRADLLGGEDDFRSSIFVH